MSLRWISISARTRFEGVSTDWTSRRLAMRQGRCRAGWIGIESTVDLQLRQSLLQFVHTGVGDLSSGNVQMQEIG